MAKLKPKPATTAATSQMSSNKSSRKKTILTILLLIIAVGAGFMFVRHNQEQKRQAETLAADKATFAIVEQEVDEAYKAVTTNIGKPDVARSYRSCSRVAFKFDNGIIVCGPGFSLGYSQATPTDAGKQFGNLKNALASSGGFKLDVTSDSQNSPDAGNASIDVVYTKDTSIKCKLDYKYDKPEFHLGFETIKSTNATFYNFKCTKALEKAIYTLAE